jgi:polyhydroxyalkanoate synthesis repressor PhaR
MDVIKKYANRKLYFTTQKRYITLDEVAELVRQEAAFVVLDNETGADITADILKQVIAQSRKHFSVPLLAGLIRAGNEALVGVSRSVQERLDSSGLIDLVVERRISQLLEQGVISSSEANRIRQVLFQEGIGLGSLLFDVPTRSELLSLARQVEELTQVVQELNNNLQEEK